MPRSLIEAVRPGKCALPQTKRHTRQDGAAMTRRHAYGIVKFTGVGYVTVSRVVIRVK